MGRLFYDDYESYDYEEVVVRTNNKKRDSFKGSKKAEDIKRKNARRDKMHQNSLTCALERM